MNTNDLCDLLIVSHEDKLHVVEAPSHVCYEGDLVEFAPISVSVPVLGEVVDKLFCAKDSDEYRFISKIAPIHPARRIYNVRWEAWEGEDELCGG